MKWGVLWHEMRVFAIGIKADGVATCLAQGNRLYEGWVVFGCYR